MKKTIFILTLLLPCCLLFAQPDSDVSQLGIDNSVEVEQTGFLNYSLVRTRGDFNTPSFVDQMGDGVNNSYVRQGSNATPADGNTADVTQENDYLLSGDDNESDINQDGHFNTATVEQIAEQSIHGVARTSDIDQLGSGNTAWVYQKGKMSDAKIHQSGDDNTGRVKQEGNKLDGYINQSGWANFAAVKQAGYKQDADIDQRGAWGIAKQLQGKRKIINPHTESRLNEAKILQTGFAWGSTAEQHQDGKQNYAYIKQDASDLSTAMQIQVNLEGHNTFGTGHDVNVADIRQRNGENNEAYQFQHFSVHGADPNFANVVQDGSNHYSLETQYGGGNSSNVDQGGDGNYSDVTQNKHSVTPPGYSLPAGF